MRQIAAGYAPIGPSTWNRPPELLGARYRAAAQRHYAGYLARTGPSRLELDA